MLKIVVVIPVQIQSLNQYQEFHDQPCYQCIISSRSAAFEVVALSLRAVLDCS